MKVYCIFVDGEGIPVEELDLPIGNPLAVYPVGAGSIRHPEGRRSLRGFHRRREGLQGFTHLLCNVHRTVAVHLDHSVRNVEEGAGASCHQDGGDAQLVKKLSRPLNERGDRLFFSVDDALHQLVPHHEVGGRGILVDEKGMAAGENALHDSGRLGGGAAGIFCGEVGGILSIGQVIDKQGDVCVLNIAPILCPQL